MASGVAGGTPSKQDKASFVEGTDYTVPMGAVVNDTMTADVAEDKIGAPRMTPKRGLHVSLRDTAGAAILPALDATIVASNALLTSIAANTDGLEGYTDGIETLLGDLKTYTDGLETLLSTTNSTLATIDGHVDGLEGFTDGIEALLTTISGFVDGIETLIGTTNANLVTLDGHVDQLEGYTDGIETLLTSISGFVDGLEAALAGTLTVTGPLTDTQLRATPVPVSGTVTASGPLTDTQLRASAVPVSAASLPLPTGAATSARQDTGNSSLSSIDGKITAVNTGAVTISSALPAGTNNIGKTSPAAFVTTSGTLQSAAAATGNGSTLAVDGCEAAMITVTGTFVGTITIEGTEDGTNYVSMMRKQIGATDTSSNGITTTGVFVAHTTGFTLLRARISAYTSGSITVTGHAVPNGNPGFIASVGDVSHDSVDANAPNKIGAKATSSISAQTSVATADRTNLFAGVDGVLIVRENTNLEDIVSGVAAITDGSSTSVIAAQGASIKTYVTDVVISNSGTTDVTVDLRDGTGGSVKATYPAKSGTLGVVHPLRTPIPFSANTAVAADPSGSSTTVSVTLVGFKSRV